MSVAGAWKSPAIVVADAGWVNASPAAIQNFDGWAACCSTTDEAMLVVADLGFGALISDTIDGIEWGHAAGTGCGVIIVDPPFLVAQHVQLVESMHGDEFYEPRGLTRGSDIARGSTAEVILGSSTDRWGLTLTPTQVNSTGFGLRIYKPAAYGVAELRVDRIRARIWTS